jgi:hypothetical protein
MIHRFLNIVSIFKNLNQVLPAVYSQRIPQANLHTVLIFVQAKNCRHYIYYSYLKVLSVGRYCRSKCAKAYRKKVVFMLSLKIPKGKRLPFATAPKVI